MNTKVRLKRNVYFIIIGVMMLAFTVQITHSQYILQFSINESLADSVNARKSSTVADSALYVPSGTPYCLAFDSTDEYSRKVKENAEHLFKYMKKPVRSVDVHNGKFSPKGCKAVVASVEQLQLLGDADVIAKYVEQGGYVFFTVRLEQNDTFYRLYRKMGIIAAHDPREVQGVELTSHVLIGEKGLFINDPFIINSSMIVELDDKSRILAKSAGGIPLLWDSSYGQGKFMVFNGTMLQEKINRGLLAGAISLLEPNFIYPIFNSKIMYIDDFPAPIPKGLNVGIYRTYHRDIPTFFKEIWWPNMLKAAKRYDIKYTAVLIESYNDRVQPPFDSPIDADSKGLISYGREVIKSGGEIGLHGYNHQSLQLSQEVADNYGYYPWSSVDTMAESVSEAVRFAGTAFPNYTMLSYVPPSNVLSPEGRKALKQGWPTITVIASLYAEDDTGQAYVQEYEIAPDGILEMPRITSGYYEILFDRWAEANAITSIGVFSHFLHPDDLLNRERSNGLSWEKLYEQYVKLLARLERTYPWMRPMTSTEAAIDMESALTSRIDWHQEGQVLKGKIEPFNKPSFYVLRTEQKIGKLIGCKVQRIDTGTYLVTAGKADFTIELGE